MKQRAIISTMILAIILLAGCEEKSPGIIDSIIFNEDGEWLTRETSADPYEWVDDACCNDWNPYPLALGSDIQPVLEPVDDLDYYRVSVDSGTAGQLILSTIEDFNESSDQISLRIFNSNLKEYEDIWLDERPFTTGGLRYWTTLYDPGDDFIVLVSGSYSGGSMNYRLAWEAADTSGNLDLLPFTINQPPFNRGQNCRIGWFDNQSAAGHISIALMKGPVIIELILTEYLSNWTDHTWSIPTDLKPGFDYRLVIFRTFNPTTMDISDAFEIR
ncbi:MAG: hypothetical protein KAU50_11880 [Candidatus Marinimicrobia bacterium]|nr:hypothetical protein [Candidatus Neomarinimicrobiota bacterium]